MVRQAHQPDGFGHYPVILVSELVEVLKWSSLRCLVAEPVEATIIMEGYKGHFDRLSDR